MKTMAFKLHQQHLLLVHSKHPPEKEEWAPYMEAATRMDEKVGGDLQKAGILVFSDGGAPNASQRHEINIWLHGRRIRTAVVLTSPMARGAVTVLSWFNKDIKAFDPESWKDALRYVGISSNDEAGVQSTMTSLAGELGGTDAVKRAFAKSP